MTRDRPSICRSFNYRYIPEFVWHGKQSKRNEEVLSLLKKFQRRIILFNRINEERELEFVDGKEPQYGNDRLYKVTFVYKI